MTDRSILARLIAGVIRELAADDVGAPEALDQESLDQESLDEVAKQGDGLRAAVFDLAYQVQVIIAENQGSARRLDHVENLTEAHRRRIEELTAVNGAQELTRRLDRVEKLTEAHRRHIEELYQAITGARGLARARVTGARFERLADRVKALEEVRDREELGRQIELPDAIEALLEDRLVATLGAILEEENIATAARVREVAENNGALTV